jgi:hypothetical protein
MLYTYVKISMAHLCETASGASAEDIGVRVTIVVTMLVSFNT